MIAYLFLVAVGILACMIFWLGYELLGSLHRAPIARYGLSILGVIAVFAVLIFDQWPFYGYAKYLHSKHGGVIVARTAPHEDGYLMAGPCEMEDPYSRTRRFSSACYLLLFDSPLRKKSLKFLEFELKAGDADVPSSFFKNRGAGIYQITLQKKSLEDCPILQDLKMGLAEAGKKHKDGLQADEFRMLQSVISSGQCPVVRKVDQASSRYREGESGEAALVFTDGIHRITRSEGRSWLPLDGSKGLFRRARYCVEGSLILWGNQSDVWPPILCTGDDDLETDKLYKNPVHVFGLN